MHDPKEVTVSHLNGTVTSHDVYYRDPEKEPPPRGVMLLLYTIGGIVVRGQWLDNAGFLAWAPLPKVPDWLREKASKAYTPRSR